MHDFGVSPSYTIILDLPMSLDPINMLRGRPIINYDQYSLSRFGIFPRHDPARVRWFETEPCFIFHTASTWDEIAPIFEGDDQVEAVNMLACRYKSADMLYSMGGIENSPCPRFPEEEGSDSRLYYYQFLLSDTDQNSISHQWALSAIPFEMPIVSPSCTNKAPTFIYGCSSKDAMFGASTGEPMKVDCLVKIDVKTLIRRGIEQKTKEVDGCVDNRDIKALLGSDEIEDPIKVFQAPEGWFAQEPRFVSRDGATTEDDGYLLTLMFDESQLNEDGSTSDVARSELWVIEAGDMTTVVAKIFLPQRVPYGFHGNWFTRQQIEEQRPYISSRTELWPDL